jgi:hypothetical protein
MEAEVVKVVPEYDELGHPKGEPVTDKMMADCFKALALSILGEFFMSSDTKYFIFMGMLNNLEKVGYTEEQIDIIRERTNRIIQTYHTKNDFMG